ncbi:hypothetical protein BG011_006271 [Mortierella polycephala]|uniref:RNI-like protein n=1 Tax=Mortierella polycephala TaxID=41804 RepID=A0A9P6QEU5_9FUNG|nr:hypothetical protein BG011_006271 [Mortierella polycephala]
MLDLRSYRTSPYQQSLVLHRSRFAGSASLAKTLPAGSSENSQFRARQAAPALRSPSSRSLRPFRCAHQQKQRQQKQQSMTRMTMTAVERQDQTDNDQEMTPEDMSLPQKPAILRLCPELLAMIFHYVYITPVVHHPTSVSANLADITTEQPHHPQRHHTNSDDLSITPPSSTPLPLGTTTEIETETRTTMVTTTSDPPFHSAISGAARRKKDKRKSAVYIQNDISSMLALCLTCRSFYPHAIRMLWRQRTLANYDDLTEFYQAIEFSATLQKRFQKQRQLEEQQLLKQNISYAAEEGLFNNEAALRIKSLTLLDMSLESILPLTTSAGGTSTLTTDSVSALSSQFFGSSSNHGEGAALDLSQGINSLAHKTSTDEASGPSGQLKVEASAADSSSSQAVSTSSSYTRGRSSSQSKRRSRQKTTSVYSQMISPRLLHTIANHCYALVDLTICMDKKTSTLPLSPASSSQAQPTIPFSILAGALLSLKRLTLMGLVCDPKQNKTGSELLLFARNILPLERISIRSCQGINVETFMQFAARSHRHLLSMDFQGLDFSSTQELTDMMSAFAYHCRNTNSITLSCLHSLVLDGAMEALARYQMTGLQELHILGYDTFQPPTQQLQGHDAAVAPQQQQQQQQAQQQQQQQQAVENNNQNGIQAPVTQMCLLADANLALSSLARIPLRRLTLYCPGITDFALFQYLLQSPKLVDLVLNEPTTILHHPQFYHFVQQHQPASPQPSSSEEAFDPSEPEPSPQSPAPFTSAGFFGLILSRCHWLKYMFMKLSLETAQEWIAQPRFHESGLDKCLYQYRTATGAPAVVLMWDARFKSIKSS